MYARIHSALYEPMQCIILVYILFPFFAPFAHLAQLQEASIERFVDAYS